MWWCIQPRMILKTLGASPSKSSRRNKQIPTKTPKTDDKSQPKWVILHIPLWTHHKQMSRQERSFSPPNTWSRETHFDLKTYPQINQWYNQKRRKKKLTIHANIHHSLFQFLVQNTPFCTYNDKTVEESWAYRGRRRGTWILYRTWNGVALSPNLDLLVETLRLLLPCKITEETTTKTCTLIRGLCLNEIWWYTNYHLELI